MLALAERQPRAGVALVGHRHVRHPLRPRLAVHDLALAVEVQPLAWRARGRWLPDPPAFELVGAQVAAGAERVHPPAASGDRHRGDRHQRDHGSDRERRDVKCDRRSEDHHRKPEQRVEVEGAEQGVLVHQPGSELAEQRQGERQRDRFDHVLADQDHRVGRLEGACGRAGFTARRSYSTNLI